MFRLLSKESNIFSIPLYIGLLLLIVILFNFSDFSTLDVISALITFCGVSLGCFCFSALNLNYQTHLPLFLYTAFIFTLYPGDLDLGIAMSLFTNSLILLLLTNVDVSVRKNSYLLVGTILGLNFVFLPTTWPMSIFVILHIIGTSDKIGLHFFRLLFGMFLVATSYFGIAFFLHLNSWNEAYFPFTTFQFSPNLENYVWLTPIALMIIYAVFDHFRHLNLKSPNRKFKYSFLLVFTFAQLITIILYMGDYYEYLLLLALPASIMISRMLRFLPKYYTRELGLWILILSLFMFKLVNYFNI
jgi:hypothetical protein